MRTNLARQNYLQAEVQTATPQKLQLLLVEAAIKNVHRTKKAWEEERFEAGFDSLALAQDIIAEILSSLDKKGNPDLAGKIASIYVFIFKCLAEGGMSHDPKKLDDALRVLNAERETWRLVCEKFGATVGNESTVKLDLSATSVAKSASSPAAIPKPSGISTATFARPAGFGQSVKPVGMSEPAKPAAKESAPSGGISWDV